MNKKLDVILLLALPASGKTELLKYLRHKGPAYTLENYRLGRLAVIDDFPYVHMMRKLDVVLCKMGEPECFFKAGAKQFISLDWDALAQLRYACGSGWLFKDPICWGMLTQMLNEDFHDIMTGKKEEPVSAARHIFARLDAASQAVGGPLNFALIPEEVKAKVCPLLEEDAKYVIGKKRELMEGPMDEKTFVLEFSRGGFRDGGIPIKKPYGYQYSVQVLSDEILRRASVFYVWVTPEQAEQRNATWSANQQIKLPGVPEAVIRRAFGCDDIDYLEKISDVPGTVLIEKDGKKYHLPLTRLDNRDGKLKFLYSKSEEWTEEHLGAVHESMKKTMEALPV